ncbi:hypothetical protein [Deinococcus hopiensis]|uniref:Uncharacterized protein n=1 Tax=Deinococcus hopiensis KR-140 TaxID=695939 RepID=A0A1W1VUV0_9DEIO|nr:hypothetical protein [Deinococcus hopiensis]SMB97162.1 hypothetical protein SAMN00790413_06378 [Deinococcus hopiensis KR-140]
MLVRFHRFLGMLALLCLLALLATLLVGWWFGRGAQLVQLVAPVSVTSNTLFGNSGPGTLIGSPQQMVIHDPGAFLEGRTAEGARYVSDTYLKAQNIYPLQLKTVRFVQVAVAVGFIVALLVFGSLWLVGRQNQTRV